MGELICLKHGCKICDSDGEHCVECAQSMADAKKRKGGIKTHLYLVDESLVKFAKKFMERVGGKKRQDA